MTKIKTLFVLLNPLSENHVINRVTLLKFRVNKGDTVYFELPTGESVRAEVTDVVVHYDGKSRDVDITAYCN